jgi:hypothetical protein
MMNLLGNINLISYLCNMKQYKDTPYYITEDGKVWSSIRSKYLKPQLRGSYLQVDLGKGNPKAIHRLVAETYLPNPNNLPMVDHNDANKFNNNVCNLEWVTHSENMDRAKLKGRMAKGELNGNSLTNSADVDKIRELYSTGKYKQIDLAKMFNVSQPTISQIIRKVTWT